MLDPLTQSEAQATLWAWVIIGVALFCLTMIAVFAYHPKLNRWSRHQLSRIGLFRKHASAEPQAAGGKRFYVRSSVSSSGTGPLAKREVLAMLDAGEVTFDAEFHDDPGSASTASVRAGPWIKLSNRWSSKDLELHRLSRNAFRSGIVAGGILGALLGLIHGLQETTGLPGSPGTGAWAIGSLVGSAFGGAACTGPIIGGLLQVIVDFRIAKRSKQKDAMQPHGAVHEPSRSANGSDQSHDA
jgi:hypothetical protein